MLPGGYHYGILGTVRATMRRLSDKPVEYVSTWVERDHAERLKEMAKREDRSVSSLVRRAVGMLLQETASAE